MFLYNGFFKKAKKLILAFIIIYITIYLFIYSLFLFYVVNNKKGRKFFNFNVNVDSYIINSKNNIKTILLENFRLSKNNVDYVKLRKIDLSLVNAGYYFLTLNIKELKIEDIYILNNGDNKGNRFFFYIIKKISPLFKIDRLTVKNINISLKNNTTLLINEINAYNVRVTNLNNIVADRLFCDFKLLTPKNNLKIKKNNVDKINYYLLKYQSIISKIICNNFAIVDIKNINCTFSVDNLLDNFYETLELDSNQKFVLKASSILLYKSYCSFNSLKLYNNLFFIILNGDISCFNYKQAFLSLEIFDNNNTLILKSYIKTENNLDSYVLYLKSNFKDYLSKFLKNKFMNIQGDELVIRASIYKNSINGNCILFINNEELDIEFSFIRQDLYDFWDYKLDIKSNSYICLDYINDFNAGSLVVKTYCLPDLKLLYSTNNINGKWKLSGKLQVSHINVFLAKNTKNNIIVSRDELILLPQDIKNPQFSNMFKKYNNFILDTLDIEFINNSSITFQGERTLKLGGYISFLGDLLNPILLKAKGDIKCYHLQNINRPNREVIKSNFYIPFSISYAEINSQDSLVNSNFIIEFKYKSKIANKENDIDTVRVIGNFSGLSWLQVKLRGDAGYIEMPFITKSNLDFSSIYKNLNLNVLSIALDALFTSISSSIRDVLFKYNAEEKIRRRIEKLFPTADISLFLINIREFIVELQAIGIDCGNFAILFGVKNSIKDQDAKIFQNIYLDCYYFFDDVMEVVVSLLPLTNCKAELNFSFIF